MKLILAILVVKYLKDSKVVELLSYSCYILSAEQIADHVRRSPSIDSTTEEHVGGAHGGRGTIVVQVEKRPLQYQSQLSTPGLRIKLDPETYQRYRGIIHSRSSENVAVLTCSGYFSRLWFETSW